MTEADIREQITAAALSWGRTGSREKLMQIRELTRQLDARPSAIFTISEHAIERFMERSGCNSKARARKAIKRMLDQAEPVELMERHKHAHYFNHGVKKVEGTLYLKYQQWLFPVYNGTVVTVHNAEAGHWKKAN